MKFLMVLIGFGIWVGGVFGQNSADSFHRVGNKLYEEKKYEEAIQNWKASATVRIRDSGEVNLNVAKSYRNISMVSWNHLGKYQDGVDYALKAHKIRLKILGENHKWVADSYLNLANAYSYRAGEGDLQNAHSHFERAISICIGLGEPGKDFLANAYFDLGDLYKVERKFNKAVEYFQKSLDVRLGVLDETSPKVAESYNGLGAAYLDLMSLDSALFFIQKSLQIRQNLFGDQHLDAAASYNNLGNVYFQRTDYGKALVHHNKALDIQISVLGNDLNNYTAVSYLNIGTDFDRQGEYYKALEYYLKALAIKSSLIGEEHLELCDYLGNIGQEYHLIGDEKNAIFYQEKAIAIRLKAFGEKYPGLGTNYNSIGLIYESQKKFDKALGYLQHALEIRKDGFGERHPLVAESYNNLGTLYTNMDNFDLALYNFEKANSIRLEISGNDNPDVAGTWFSMGVVFMNKEIWEKADEYFKKALKSIRYEGEISRATNTNLLITFLNSYSICYLRKYKQTGELSNLLTALKYSKEAIAVVKYQTRKIQMEGTQNWWTSQSQPVFDQQIRVEKLLAELNNDITAKQNIFSYSEQTKSRFLQTQIKALNALNVAGIPKELLILEHDLRIGITWREKHRQLLFQSGKPEMDTSILALNSKIFDLHQQYEQLIHRFEAEYPAYFKLKYDLHTETVESVQRDLLKPGETLLEYFTGDSSIYIFVVQTERYEIIEVPRDFPLDDWVKDLRSGIMDWYLKKDSVTQYKDILDRYANASNNLYGKLIAPIESLIPPNGRIFIIPNGVLAYIPFEALISERPPDILKTGRYKYWLLEHEISYCYSATLLREMRERKHRIKPGLLFLGVAPTYAESATNIKSSFYDLNVRAGHQKLDSNIVEVKYIQKMFGGQIYTGVDATEDRFVQEAWKYRMIHTALHGEANDRSGDYSYLAFYETPEDNLENEWLYVREIYDLSLNADMVTLSACQTGLGELRQGEGIIGLTRAFTYAGAKSIINSLWTIPDGGTKNFMVNFYQHLKSGESKDLALASTKRSMIRSGTFYSHPFFWAGFIGVGDMKKIEF